MSKNQKPLASARIPHEWMEQIKSICEESGKTPSEVMQDAIGQYLGKTTVGSVTSLAQRVTALERKYQKLAALITS